MADQKDAASVFQERTFQFFFCVYIQMIGGFVQQQDIGFRIQNLTQADLCLFPAA